LTCSIRVSLAALAVALATTAPTQALAQSASAQSAPAQSSTPAAAPTAAEDLAAMRAQLEAMTKRINALEAQLAARQAAAAEPQLAQQSAGLPIVATAPTMAAAAAPAPTPAPAPVPAATPASGASPTKLAKKDGSSLTIRGYAQVRYNHILSGDVDAPAGRSRLRSVQDSGIGSDTNFSFRRIRLVFQGDLGNGISYYLQPDFAVAVNNQSSGERRENFAQLRDAYVDIALDKNREFKLRLGQSKVPFGWENLQSSSNRIPLDRTDGINSAVPGERDIGLVAYYTPASVQAIWDDLSKDGQKLFGNYGAFGLGVFNGQGTNRPERNDGLMTVAMGTWPVRLDGLGPMFKDQVFEFGGALMHNTIRPEVRSGGVSEVGFKERRVGLHAVLYPKPFGIQAEWAWGKGPQFDTATQSIDLKGLSGGYVMAMYRVNDFLPGSFIPFARWERYRGGWKAAVNAPRLETQDFEVGFEWAPVKPIELTLSYARMQRREADERRTGRAEGNVVRAQVQWNY